MQQLSFFPPAKKAHGGALTKGRRRSRRPLDIKLPLHITLRSQHAYGERSLTKHRALIRRILHKAANLYRIRIYEYAVCSNHIHILIRGKRRENIQNFFRVFAGHAAQEILSLIPLKQPTAQKGCRKNQRMFWEFLIYSRVLSWGREYKTVKRYLLRNILEALSLIAYQPRTRPRRRAPA